MISAWRKWRLGGMTMCNTIAAVVANKDNSDPMNVGIAMTRLTGEVAMMHDSPNKRLLLTCL